MEYNTATLGCGLRVIHLPSNSPIVYCGFEVKAGSRDEAAGEEGLAHFCEHTTFKGTRRRSALQVINALEGVGGELNAYTNKEETVYYAAILKEHVGRAIDLLADIVFRSTYPQHEIDKEVEVICDEIESYNDSPSELIYDEFDNLIFAGHPLGHNILGEASHLRTYTTADALRFTRKHYLPRNAVFFVSGDVSFRSVVRRLEESLSDLGEPSATGASAAEPSLATPVLPKAERIVRERGTHQAHVMVGTLGCGAADERRMPLYLLNNIIGGPSMSSRLNLVLRERHGLVYTVESSAISYRDAGVWNVYFGCDAKDVERCLRLLRREMSRLAERPLSDRQLSRAKRQIKGQIGVACDNRETFALDFGKLFLHYGWERHLSDLFARIDAVSASDIRKAAEETFSPDRLVTLIYR